jgi:hypothetical protein
MKLATAPNVVFHYFLYFSSPFANFSKGLEISLSLSPAKLFSGASLPNHTKMFELVHLVTSVEDFGRKYDNKGKMKDIKARMYVAHTHTKAGINQIPVAEDKFSQQTFFCFTGQCKI